MLRVFYTLPLQAHSGGVFLFNYREGENATFYQKEILSQGDYL